MKEMHQQFHFRIGLRNLKTAFAATLCAILYFPFGRNPTFACIGAIFGLGNDMGHSWLSGGNRFFGTIIGGFIGMACFRAYICFYPEGGYHPLLFLFLFIGVVVLILACQFFKWPGGIQPGGVVLCIILFNTPVATYITYSLNRMLDTGVGFAVALLVNLLLPRERLLRWLGKSDRYAVAAADDGSEDDLDIELDVDVEDHHLHAHMEAYLEPHVEETESK